jgi:hypothetical protein
MAAFPEQTQVDVKVTDAAQPLERSAHPRYGVIGQRALGSVSHVKDSAALLVNLRASVERGSFTHYCVCAAKNGGDILLASWWIWRMLVMVISHGTPLVAGWRRFQNR